MKIKDNELVIGDVDPVTKKNLGTISNDLKKINNVVNKLIIGNKNVDGKKVLNMAMKISTIASEIRSL